MTAATDFYQEDRKAEASFSKGMAALASGLREMRGTLEAIKKNTKPKS